MSHPLSITVFHYGTSDRDEDELLQIVKKNFDLRPGVIVRYVKSLPPPSRRSPEIKAVRVTLFPVIYRELGLKRPIYQATACYGHFGRKEFPWEQPKKLVF